jgi:hypothetical protein
MNISNDELYFQIFDDIWVSAFISLWFTDDTNLLSKKSERFCYENTNSNQEPTSQYIYESQRGALELFHYHSKREHSGSKNPKSDVLSPAKKLLWSEKFKFI